MVDMLADFGFDIAWQAATIDHLHIVVKVARVVDLLGMAHRDIPLLNQIVQCPGFRGCPEFFQFREIIPHGSLIFIGVLCIYNLLYFLMLKNLPAFLIVF